MARMDASHLPGTYETRVFVGGSYLTNTRNDLAELKLVVESVGLHPIVADEFDYGHEDDLHDVTMSLLHMCRLAVFELSRLSGALMEVERLPDYGTKALLLYISPKGQGHLPSRMLSSFVAKHARYITTKGYSDPIAARRFAKRWLEKQKGRP